MYVWLYIYICERDMNLFTPCGPPWVLAGRTLVGWAFVGPWALMGQALMGPPGIHIYIYICVYTYIYIYIVYIYTYIYIYTKLRPEGGMSLFLSVPD